MTVSSVSVEFPMLIKLKGLISAADLKLFYFDTTSTLEVLAVFITFLSLSYTWELQLKHISGSNASIENTEGKHSDRMTNRISAQVT